MSRTQSHSSKAILTHSLIVLRPACLVLVVIATRRVVTRSVAAGKLVLDLVHQTPLPAIAVVTRVIARATGVLVGVVGRLLYSSISTTKSHRRKWSAREIHTVRLAIAARHILVVLVGRLRVVGHNLALAPVLLA